MKAILCVTLLAVFGSSIAQTLTTKCTHSKPPTPQDFVAAHHLAVTQPKAFAKLIDQYVKDPACPLKLFESLEKGCIKGAISFLNSVSPRKGFTLDRVSAVTCMRHSKWMDSQKKMDHTGANNSSPWDRVGQLGTLTGPAGENLFQDVNLKHKSANYWVAGWIIDPSVLSRGHRNAIFNEQFSKVGCYNYKNWPCCFYSTGIEFKTNLSPKDSADIKECGV